LKNFNETLWICFTVGCYYMNGWTAKLSQYITNTKVNSAFHPSGVGKSRPACLAGVKAEYIHLCWVARNTV